jgi:hypothetical protein
MSGHRAACTRALLRTLLPLLPFLLFLRAGEVDAQGPRETDVPCDGAIVTAIEFTPHDPLDLEVPRVLHWLASSTGLLHTTTRPGAIGSFLLLEVGEPCTEIERAESERILRIQPFLAHATVHAVPDSTGGVRIEVQTIDEFALVFGMRFRGLTPSSILFGNDNVRGQGLSLAANVERGDLYRTGAGIRGVANQVLGRPYRIRFVAQRAPLGGTVSVDFAHPFFTDLQRNAWHMGFADENRYSSFLPADGDALSLRVRRSLWDLGVVRRVGLGRRSAFAGVLLTREAVSPDDRVVIVSDSGLVVDESGSLGAPAPGYRNVRVNAVVGVRALSFKPVRGFDALNAVQDVATGAQIGTLVGRGVPRLGDDGDDIFVSTDLYAGVGSASSFAAMRIEGEARRDAQTDRWESMVLSGRLAWYLKRTSTQVLITSVEYGGVWRMRVPFQLTLGDRGGGVRGYSDSRVAGARRGVARLEGRWSLGRLGGHGALGLAGFADAGRVWAGDAPFGVNSPTRVGLGVGLLAAVPRESQRLWRLDLVVPVSADRHAGWEIRLTSIRTRVVSKIRTLPGREASGANRRTSGAHGPVPRPPRSLPGPEPACARAFSGLEPPQSQMSRLAQRSARRTASRRSSPWIRLLDDADETRIVAYRIEGGALEVEPHPTRAWPRRFDHVDGLLAVIQPQHCRGQVVRLGRGRNLRPRDGVAGAIEFVFGPLRLTERPECGGQRRASRHLVARIDHQRSLGIVPCAGRIAESRSEL